MTIDWLACELHTHTIHSDATHTLSEMAEAARELEFDWIALTDHNTVSGLIGKETVVIEQGISILPGMEWTTFYGHMLTLGANVQQTADWRLIGADDIGKGLTDIHESGGIAGIAHPFRIGSPICTGCFWEFAIGKWQLLDYIEVWNGTSPNMKSYNRRAFEYWTELLNLGIRITALSGRDWHHSQVSGETTISVTYLGLGLDDRASEHDSGGTAEQRLLKAIRHGAASVTLGPLLTLSATEQLSRTETGQTYRLGDTAVIHSSNGNTLSITIEADFGVRKRQWTIVQQKLSLCLVGSKGIVAEWKIVAGSTIVEACLDLTDELWLRAELYGSMNGQEGLLAFTNCIYIEQAKTTVS
ncbi:CehA/McbA family metallohydrolase [Paenibacillus monticola]|uniref:PHP domain-containing protein n=1 Tax=Paenibacillus monticola TaxID=2666075 RepID=A0A7X2KZG4_9BACL|nr:CehA/McbA family metallohydrolase [Paenibacillus monticola]MRN51667.1 PHP domain-containing protein [Paenibacillus monticola]